MPKTKGRNESESLNDYPSDDDNDDAMPPTGNASGVVPKRALMDKEDIVFETRNSDSMSTFNRPSDLGTGMVGKGAGLGRC